MHCEIRSESYVNQNGEKVSFEALPEETKKAAATELKLRWLRELFGGRAEFYEKECQRR